MSEVPFQRRHFAAEGDVLVTHAAEYEVEMLVSMVGQLIDLVAPERGSEDVCDDPFSTWEKELDGTADLDDDPALDRLFPDAYADAEAAGEFRRYTQDALVARKVADAEAVLRSLHAWTADDSQVVVPVGEAYAWLRTIVALRLIIGTRLGIEGPDDHEVLLHLPESDPRSYAFGVFMWLEDWLEGLLRQL